MLRLVADDADDLQVISAQMQDALIRRADLNFDKKRRRFAFVANRFAWEAMPQRQRRRAGLHFDDVTAVKVLGFDKTSADAVLSLLAITFTRSGTLAGMITLAFSAAKEIRLSVDCINVTLADLGQAWAAETVPDHKA